MAALIRLEPGQLFAGDFEVIRPLAEGGMGAVYVARQKSTGHERALKIMLPQFVADGPSRARFEQEAVIGSKIESDHVVQVVSAGIDEPTGTPWIAMELLRGESLGARIESRGPLSRETACLLFDQLRHALGAAHARNIVHRDLKPENIFIAESRTSSAASTVKVLDFGIARIVRENQTAATVTAALGSPLWMAPEQAQTGAHLRASTDVWALGLIAFYVLTAKSYWRCAQTPTGINVAALLIEMMVDPLAPPSVRSDALGVAHLLPGGFDAWFARCVVRDPDARFRDAREALDALLALLSPVSATASWPGPVSVPTPTPTPFKTVAMEFTPAQTTTAMPPQTYGQPPGQRPVPIPHQLLKPPTPTTPLLDFAVPVGLLVLTLGAGGVWYATKRHDPSRPEDSAQRALAAPAAEVAAEIPMVPESEVVENETARAPEAAAFPRPTSPDPRGGDFTLSNATRELGGSGAIIARIDTSRGAIRCTLDYAEAPYSVANFVGLARGIRDFWNPIVGEWQRAPFYDGSTFHRVIPGFMIQGGDFLRSGRGGTGYEFTDENVNGHNAAGLLCMANHGPNTNGGQFFITDGPAPHLDGSYSIFGRCAPTALVHRIATEPAQGDRPDAPVVIRSITITRQ